MVKDGVKTAWRRIINGYVQGQYQGQYQCQGQDKG